MVRQSERNMGTENMMTSLKTILRRHRREVLWAPLLLALAAPTGQAASKGPDTYGYNATDATVFSYVDISSGGAAVLAGTDDGTAALNLPFTFQFYGVNYTIVCASTNGALYFVPDTTTCAGEPNDFANTDLSVAGPPGNLPAALPFWTDLTFQVPGAGAIYYQTIGASPSRQFIVQWSNAYPQGSPNPVNFQLILAESSNSITFQYQTVTLGAGNPANNGALATAGIRSRNGAVNGQIEWSFDAPALSNSYALIFTPPVASPPSPPPPVTPQSQASVITWNNPAAIAYGTALSATQLDATANVAGTFTYNPALGTVLNAGVQTLSVSFSPTVANYLGATATVSLTVNQATQKITFGSIPGHTTGDAPFALSASASSGLTVAFSIVSGPATLSGNTLTITGTGTVAVQATQAGNSNYLAATAVTQSFSVAAPTVTGTPVTLNGIQNAASEAITPLAPDGFEVLYGSGFTNQTETASSTSLPTTLGGVTIVITDSAGKQADGLLYYVSPTQINFVVPEGLAPGPVTVTVSGPNLTTASMSSSIAAIAPAIFTADFSGKGAAAAVAVAYAADGSSQVLCGVSQTCDATPIDLSTPGTSVWLMLFGTGIRGRSSLSGVTVTANGTALNVGYAGAQPTYEGLDQVNVLLDPSLLGHGQVSLQLTVDGVAANPVLIDIK